MTTKINGRTPEEIKKGLECCTPRYESQHWVTCSSECPFRNESAYCRNVLHACTKKYIQQLERERNAAVKDLQKGNRCPDCAHYYEPVMLKIAACSKCFRGANWQWRGVQEVE